MTKGIIYIATGEQYIKDAKKSASVTSQKTDLPITLIADRPVNSAAFDKVIVDENAHNDYLDKPRNLLKSPYDRTLFLDTDVYLLEDVPELFSLIEDFDLAAAVDPNEAALRKENLRYFDNLPESVPEFNTGVLAFQINDDTEEFFKAWMKYYSKSHIMDQPSFRKALKESKIQFTPMSTIYNCLLDYPMQITGEVKIIHDIHGYIDTDNFESVEARINRSPQVRVLHSRQEEVAYPLSKLGDMFTRILWSLNQDIVQGINLFHLFRENTEENGYVNSIYKSVRFVLKSFQGIYSKE